MLQHRILQAPRVVRRGQRQEGRLASGELEHGGAGHGDDVATVPPACARRAGVAEVGTPTPAAEVAPL